MFNRPKIEPANQLCGCFCCMTMFDSSEINNWTDKGRTALCPQCGIDSVLSQTTDIKITDKLLEAMYKRWFNFSQHDFDFIPVKK